MVRAYVEKVTGINRVAEDAIDPQVSHHRVVRIALYQLQRTSD